MRVTIVQNRRHKPLQPLSHQHQEVEVRREKEPKMQKPVWEVQSTAVETLFARYLHSITLYYCCLLEDENLSKRCIDESVESKNSFWIAGWLSLRFCFWPIEIPPIREYSITRNTARIRLVRGREILERSPSWKQSLSRCTRWTRQNSTLRGSTSKEMILHKWWNRIPIADGTENFFRGYQDLRSPPWQGFIQDRGEVQHDLLGESDGFPPTTKAWNRCASPQNIQWSATTSPTAKNCREVLWQNWARTTSTSRLTIWQYGRDKVSKHILKGSWKYRESCRQGKFDTFCFFFFWRHVAGRELIRTVDKFSMSLSPSTFESPETLSRHLQLWTVRMRRKAQGYSKHQVDRLEVQGNLTQEEEEIPIPTQFSRMAKGCSTGWTSRATCRDRKKDQEPLELSGDWRCRETCRTKIQRISRKPRTSRKIRRLGNRR